MTPEQEARYASDRGQDRETLSPAAQLIWDELAAAEAELEAIRAEHARLSPAGPPRGRRRLRRAIVPAIAGAIAGGLTAFLFAFLAGSPAPAQPSPGITVSFAPATFSPLPFPAARP